MLVRKRSDMSGSDYTARPGKPDALDDFIRQNTGKRYWRRAFFSGVIRGLGMAVGFSILGAVLIYILQWLAGSFPDALGDFIADIVWVVRQNLLCK